MKVLFSFLWLFLSFSIMSNAQGPNELEVTNSTDCDIIVVGFAVDAGSPGCTGSYYMTQQFVLDPGQQFVIDVNNANWNGAVPLGGVDWEYSHFPVVAVLLGELPTAVIII